METRAGTFTSSALSMPADEHEPATGKNEEPFLFPDSVFKKGYAVDMVMVQGASAAISK